MAKLQKSASDEYMTFNRALRKVLQVSKSDLNRMLAEEKRANAGKLKRGPKPRSSSARASHAQPSADKD
jgi:hypothetical protein